MEILAKLVRKHKLSRICRIGAWVLAIAGVIQMSLQAYNIWLNYHQMQLQLENAPSNVSFLNSQPPISLQLLSSVLQGGMFYLFYFIVLYAASVVFEAIGTQATTTRVSQQASEPALEAGELEQEDIVYTSLKREDILQGKLQINNHRQQSGKL